jgi:hypothetical protein
MQSQIHVASAVMAAARSRITGIAASDGWENYCMVVKHKFVFVLTYIQS